MNYSETIDFMYSQLPMFHRVGKAAYKANLDNAVALDALCGHPHLHYKTIHVAGTNGKGSVSHMLAAILQTAGYKTGLFTSPHLTDFRERIKVNGSMIPEEAVIAFVEHHREQFLELKPSFFEMTSALAFDFFAREKVEVAIIEVGLGGRLDSTNIIHPELSVITNIGYDHMDLLGNTLSAIATEKAGIIKQGVPVVIGESLPETAPVFLAKAAQMQSRIYFADQRYAVTLQDTQKEDHQKLEVHHLLNGQVQRFQLDLLGHYQQRNIRTVLTAVDELAELGWQITSRDILLGLEQASCLTGLRGRWQVLQKAPLMICDTGHNEDGIRGVVQQIGKTRFEKLHFIFGVVNDKEISHILPLLPREAVYYFTRASIPRAMDEQLLAEMARLENLHGHTYPQVAEAIQNAKKNASPNDLIFIGGSTFVVADALSFL